MTSIFLVGPMGSGKSTVGRALANKIGYQFLDSDREIEARCGVDIPTIFDYEGESGFRDRESRMINELTNLPGIVLATGGGSVLREENRTYLQDRVSPLMRSCTPWELPEAMRLSPSVISPPGLALFLFTPQRTPISLLKSSEAITIRDSIRT